MNPDIKRLDTSVLAVGDKLPVLQVDISAQKIIAAAAATRDWQPLHHDYAFATQKAGTPDIIMNSPTQAGWISKYLTDWAGPLARVQRMSFKMKDAICPGSALCFEGVISRVEDRVDEGLALEVEVLLTVAGDFKTKARVLMMLPNEQLQNPWSGL
ncbi:MAG: hypothetical protein KDI30_02575 [Pseudomonadales bacterium]|nr:hypothetical protein [Pseudomonadales bacterium]